MSLDIWNRRLSKPLGLDDRASRHECHGNRQHQNDKPHVLIEYSLAIEQDEKKLNMFRPIANPGPYTVIKNIIQQNKVLSPEIMSSLFVRLIKHLSSTFQTLTKPLQNENESYVPILKATNLSKNGSKKTKPTIDGLDKKILFPMIDSTP